MSIYLSVRWRFVSLMLTLFVALLLSSRSLALSALRNAGHLVLLHLVAGNPDTSPTRTADMAKQLIEWGGGDERALGVLAFQSGHLDEAIQRYSTELFLTGDPIARYLLGEALLADNRTDSAVETWRGLSKGTTEALARHYNEEAQAALNRGDWEPAVSFSLLALKLDSSLSSSYYYLGLGYAGLGKWREAVTAYQKAQSSETDSVDKISLYLALGDAYLNLNDDARAMDAYREASNGSPRNLRALEYLAALYLRKGDYAEAEDNYRAILSMDGKYVQAYLGMGNVARLRHDPRQAQFWYERAQEVSPGSGLGEYALGQLARERGDYTQAIQYLRKAAELQPGYVFVWVDLARSYRLAGQKAEAVSAYQQALTLAGINQGSVGIQEEFATTLAEQGNTVGAISAWRQILTLDPGNSAAREALAKLP